MCHLPVNVLRNTGKLLTGVLWFVFICARPVLSGNARASILCVDATAHTCGSSLERLKASLNLHRVLSTCGLFPPCSPLTSSCRTMPGLQSSQAPCFHIGLLPKPRPICLSQDAPCQDTLHPAGLTRHGAEGRASETDCDSPSSEMPDTGPC